MGDSPGMFVGNTFGVPRRHDNNTTMIVMTQLYDLVCQHGTAKTTQQLILGVFGVAKYMTTFGQHCEWPNSKT